MGLPVEKSRVTNLKAPYNEVTALVEEGIALGVPLSFSKASDTICRNTVTDKLRKNRLPKGTVRWTQSCWKGWARGL